MHCMYVHNPHFEASMYLVTKKEAKIKLNQNKQENEK